MLGDRSLPVILSSISASRWKQQHKKIVRVYQACSTDIIEQMIPCAEIVLCIVEYFTASLAPTHWILVGATLKTQL